MYVYIVLQPCWAVHSIFTSIIMPTVSLFASRTLDEKPKRTMIIVEFVFVFDTMFFLNTSENFGSYRGVDFLTRAFPKYLGKRNF